MRSVYIPMPDGTTQVEQVINPKHKWIVVDVRKTGHFINNWWGYATKRTAVAKLKAWQQWQEDIVQRHPNYQIGESTYHLLPVMEEQA